MSVPFLCIGNSCGSRGQGTRFAGDNANTRGWPLTMTDDRTAIVYRYPRLLAYSTCLESRYGGGRMAALLILGSEQSEIEAWRDALAGWPQEARDEPPA